MHNASAHVSSLFIELLERQFQVESPHQKLNLRTAKDYADRLAVHVNHLNKGLKENTAKQPLKLSPPSYPGSKNSFKTNQLEHF